MIKKIISSGFTDADRAALDAAIKMGVSYGGWIPKERRTEEGSLPPKYRLQEMATEDYHACIEQNVIDAKGTLILTHGRPTGFSDFARKITLRHKRQLLGVDFKQTISLKAASLIHGWMRLQRIDILCIIGSSTSTHFDMAKQTKQVVEGALLLSLMDAHPGFQLADYTHEEYLKKHGPAPKTVDQAVDLLIAEMPLREKTLMANLQKEEIEPLTMSLGIYIRNNLFARDLDKDLFKSCCSVAGNVGLSENRAAFVIIENLWERLRKTHKLRIVK